MIGRLHKISYTLVQPPIEVVIHDPDTDSSAFSAFGLDDDGLLFDAAHDHQDQGHGTGHAENDHGYPVHDGLGDSLGADLDAQGHGTSNAPDLPNLSDGGAQAESSTAASNLESDPYAHVGLSSDGESLDSLLADKASPTTPTGNAHESAHMEAGSISTVACTAQEMIDAAARQVESQ